MRQRSIQQIQRLSILISFMVILAIGWIIARALGYGQPAIDGIPAQRFVWAMFNQEIVLISGHAGHDSGAVCEDDNGNAILTEAEIVARLRNKLPPVYAAQEPASPSLKSTILDWKG